MAFQGRRETIERQQTSFQFAVRVLTQKAWCKKNPAWKNKVYIVCLLEGFRAPDSWAAFFAWQSAAAGKGRWMVACNPSCFIDFGAYTTASPYFDCYVKLLCEKCHETIRIKLLSPQHLQRFVT
jgi:hypothetical protein